MEVFKENMRVKAVDVVNTTGRNIPVSRATKWGGKNLTLTEIRKIVAQRKKKNR